MINEPKQVNSGTPQGVFLKRQMVLSGDGRPIGPSDFSVGEDIQILGRNIRITAIDQYTREFYSNVGIEHAPDDGLPTDKFDKSQIKHIPVKDKQLLDYLEHSLGGGKVES